MGLLLKLQNGETKLLSLKFGKDKLGGGDSNQPFIQKKIGEPVEPGILDSDSIIRGGITAPFSAAEDVVRLTKYMLTPSGLEFIAKQNILSRVAVKTQASGVLNEGVYNPLSTLAQVGVGFLGQHLPKQGLIPGIGVESYTHAVSKKEFADNRLIKLFNKHIKESPNIESLDKFSNSKVAKFLKKFSPGDDIQKYSGGPGSVLGIGNTHIRYATSNNGITALKTNFPIPNAISNGLTYKTYQTKKDSTTTWEVGQYGQGGTKSLTTAYFSSPILDKLQAFGRHLNVDPQYQDDTHHFEAMSTDASPITLGRYNSSGSLKINLEEVGGQNAQTEEFLPGKTDAEKITSLNDPDEKGKVKGYLGNLNKNAGPYGLGGNKTTDNPYRVGGRGISYDFRSTKRTIRGFEETENGDFDNSYDYILPTDVNGSLNYEGYITDDKDFTTMDKIYYDHKNNAKKGYNGKRLSNELNKTDDYIPFNISIINPTNPTDTTANSPNHLKFRAYIDSFSDSYGSDWKGQTYMGRAEQFWKYNQFSRDINFGFTIVADNEYNHYVMYQQLNRLVSSLAPTYTSQGYMAGNLHKITLGNYIVETAGILHGMTLEVPDDSPWGTRTKFKAPLYIKVTGVKFTPIHNFRPEYKSISSNDNGWNDFIDFYKIKNKNLDI